jgi:hypothetical protein
VPGFAPESDLERRLSTEPALLEGLAWHVQHPGHPEARVGMHVASIVDGITATDRRRADLRFIALVHDSFKHQVDAAAGYSHENDHAVLAARFAQRFTRNRRLLDAIELHDEAYWIWHNGGSGLDALLRRVADPALLLEFIELDASTDGKDPSFLWWLRHQPAVRRLLPARHGRQEPLRPADAAETVYVKTFETTRATQDAVATAAAEVAATEAATLAAAGEVLRSHDGLRVLLLWRWRGSSTERLRRDGDIVRRALIAYPALATADAKEAHLFQRPRLGARPPCALRADLPC